MKRRSGQRGSAMVEMALGMAVLSSLFIGTFQFGFGFYRYNSVYNSVRGAAHYAALRDYDGTDRFSNEVKNMLLYGDPEGGTAPLIPGLHRDDITVTASFANGVPSSITVTVNNYDIDTLFKKFHLSNKPAATFPFVGRYAPQ